MGNKVLVLFLFLTIASLSTSFIISQRFRNQPKTYYFCSWFGIDCPLTTSGDPRIDEPRGRDPNLRYRIMRFF
ncbi:hypothetical protein PRIPAC_89739 [Pristionchus pacificus]|uniref:Uncharacterized protein n=1 Tax=Pristionchus pacificus TaxID=54126 RepID=A0A2A6B5I8_PRIPA|nr:hypothetical protein PRIPAC_89739 [Pristionchus pacificus]|eukprot:PDM61155.1 hypothetical protein PRIPAC_50597 [Pristionchus pacificus]